MLGFDFFEVCSRNSHQTSSFIRKLQHVGYLPRYLVYVRMFLFHVMSHSSQNHVLCIRPCIYKKKNRPQTKKQRGNNPLTLVFWPAKEAAPNVAFAETGDGKKNRTNFNKYLYAVPLYLVLLQNSTERAPIPLDR